MSTFDYYYQEQPTGQVEIDNIGNFAISCTNDLFNEYLFIAVTEMGQTRILTYGPQMIDVDDVFMPRSCNYFSMQYDVHKIEKMVDRFINDPKKCITQVTVVNIDDAIAAVKDFKELMK